MSAVPTGDLPGHVVDFVHALRDHGVPVGPGATINAGEVLGAIAIADRDVVREGLACALINRTSHRPIFDRLFDLWFPAVTGKRTTPNEDEAADEFEIERDAEGDNDLEAMRDALAEILTERDGDSALISRLVDQLGEYETRNGTAFSAYQTLKEIDLNELTAKVVAGLQQSHEGAESALSDQVSLTLGKHRVDRLRSDIEDEVRARAVERQGRERVQTYAVPKQVEDINFLAANQAELAALRLTVRSLARRLASRIANRRRRFRRGEIDLRNTLRASMSTGGVPVRLVHRKPRITRPELVVLCDISGSVAGFSQFTMLLVHALREQFSKLRIFAFIDATDEVTHYFTPEADLSAVLPQIISESKVIVADSNSDYGDAFATFVDRYPDAVTSRTSVLILGDCRTNYRNPRVDVLRGIVDTARHAHLLNPESQNYWATGDSAADVYREVIDMQECRSARQLTDAIDLIIPVH